MKVRLLYKLLAINLPVIAVVIAVVWLAIDYLAAGYFSTLMDRYHISPTESHGMFVEAIHRYMLWASGAGLLLAAGFSYLLTRRVLKPLSEMSSLSREIARGNYTERVSTGTDDEVGDLGRAFNTMADHLEHLETLRKTMVSDVAHELRTPLSNIRGYMEGLKDGVIKPDPKVFAMLQEETMRLVSLVGDLQQLTRADAARTSMRPEPLVVNDLLEKAVALYAPGFEKKRIQVNIETGTRPLRCTADRDKVGQVLRNLLANACQYADEGGKVTVAAEQGPDGTRISVTNSGEGIPEADLPYIFERFYRVDKSRSRESGGGGIGLAIVKQLIEAHGGTVGAESAGGITRVWFVLPA